MVVTVVRPTLWLEVQLTDATNIKKLERKDSRLHLYLGKNADQPQIQLNDQLFSLEQLNWRLNQLPAQDLDTQYTVILEIDNHLDMGTILDMQTLLREKGIAKIIYKTRQAPT